MEVAEVVVAEAEADPQNNIFPFASKSLQEMEAILESYMRLHALPLERLTGLCAELEMAKAENDTLDEEFFALYMSLLLCVGDLNSARYLWSRLPETFKQLPQLQALWKVGRSLFNNDFIAAFAGIDSFSWSFRYSDVLVPCMLANMRRSQINLISSAYATIGLAEISRSLNISIETAIEECNRLNWRIDLDTGIVYPKILPNFDSNSIWSTAVKDNVLNGPILAETGDLIQQLSKHIAYFQVEVPKAELSLNSGAGGKS